MCSSDSWFHAPLRQTKRRRLPTRVLYHRSVHGPRFDEAKLPSRSIFNRIGVYMKDKPQKWSNQDFRLCCSTTSFCIRYVASVSSDTFAFVLAPKLSFRVSYILTLSYRVHRGSLLKDIDNARRGDSSTYSNGSKLTTSSKRPTACACSSVIR